MAVRILGPCLLKAAPHGEVWLADGPEEAALIFETHPLAFLVLCIAAPRCTYVTNLADALAFFEREARADLEADSDECP